MSVTQRVARLAMQATPSGRSKMRGVICALLLFGSGAAFAQSETQYVIEQLVVSVNATPDGSGERVDQIKSGDRVEVLERQGDQSRVRLSSGHEGWVRSSYLSATPPLREQLKTRTDELEKLRAEKVKLEADLANARKAASAAAVTAAPPARASAPSETAPPASNPAPTVAAAADPASTANPPLFSPDPAMPSRPSWLAAILASLATLVAGFALGWRVLDRRIRARYGGLRIY